MPASAGVPKPPPPTSVTGWVPGPKGLGLGSRFTLGAKSRAATSDAQGRRLQAAGNPHWVSMSSNGAPTDPDTVVGASQLMGEAVDPSLVYGQMFGTDPNFQAISYEDPMGTVETTVAGYFSGDASAYLEDEGFYTGTGYTYQHNGAGIDANDPANNSLTSSVSTWPADLTVIPTSTTNPVRPRTVAAGFDSARKVLTTLFRDGTFYNYYGVSSLEWGNFKRARSKGRFIRLYLDGKVRGTADVGSVPQQHQELLYKTAKTVQIMRGGYQTGQKVGSKRGYNYGSQNTAARATRKQNAKAAKASGRYM